MDESKNLSLDTCVPVNFHDIQSDDRYKRYHDGEYDICLSPLDINEDSYYGVRNGILGYWNKR